jgi:hypothetical protein
MFVIFVIASGGTDNVRGPTYFCCRIQLVWMLYHDDDDDDDDVDGVRLRL